MIELPRILPDPAALRGIVQAAQAEGRPVSLIIGLRPLWGARNGLPPGFTDLGHLAAPLDWASREAGLKTVYIGLFDGPAPTGHCPPNLTLFQGGIADLHQVSPGRFAQEAVSLGLFHTDNLKRDDLLMLGEMLLVGGGLALYLFAEERSQFTGLLVERIRRAGFDHLRFSELAEGESPIPSWPKRMRRILEATLRPPRVPEISETDPFVVGVRSLLGEEADPWLLLAVSKWLRVGFPKSPLRREGDYDGIVSFTLTHVLPEDEPCLAFRRRKVAISAREAIRKLADLFRSTGPADRIEKRRPFVIALAAGYFRQGQPPYSYSGLWRWIARIAGARADVLKEVHEGDLAEVVYRHFDGFDDPSRDTLVELFLLYRARFERMGWAVPLSLRLTPERIVQWVKELIERKPGESRAQDIWDFLRRETGLPEKTLRERYSPVVLVTMWRHLSQLGEGTRRNLIQTVGEDLPAPSLPERPLGRC